MDWSAVDWRQIFTTAVLVLEYVVKIVALGLVPENRRPASAQAWLLLILFLPLVGVPLFLLIGSPYVRGRRRAIQARATELFRDATAHMPVLPETARAEPHLASVLSMSYDLTGFPCTAGDNRQLYDDTVALCTAMAERVDRAEHHVHVQFYIMRWDEATDVFFTALARAVERGVEVRLLLDHLGSRKYPGWRRFRKRMSEAGIDWHLMMPILPLKGRMRRPDLRNHRKLVVIDGATAFIGSHNLIHPSYNLRRNRRVGREWKDLTVEVGGDIVTSIQSVFLVDWFTETGEELDQDDYLERSAPPRDEGLNAMQLVPSGPGFPTEPNLRLFICLVHQAQEKLTITSPYFVPDESLLSAITTAALRGVEVELFVGEQADQFFVGHAQASYYRELLEAGVTIHLYPKPAVLHAKYLVVDDAVCAIGSSNMDFRSFILDYEVMLVAFDGDLVGQLQHNDQLYRDVSSELSLEQWKQRPWYLKYLDNACRLTSALM
ncbi:MAG TPA: cardiolipin synthase [Candidatus Avipropionibacterium avicola]|uniref:Cardiolipin synthase n=1 Tax=Candidatus Avipropionibacterium avicola TaxID=2840701 RepID=A0A9D1H0E1_9ACTN|nr:cardiolipin synthase [Candidatus Avipropionibacterium avicola]